MRLAIVGTGYVGLVAGACFADSGNTVYCVDTDAKRIEELKRGVVPIFEPGLETLVRKGLAEGRIHFTTSHADAVANSEIIFLAVGTPSLPSGDPDLKYVKDAAEEIARKMTGPRIIVNKSTVPIGSHRLVAEWMSPLTRHPFDVVSNPEFLKEGSALEDFLKPDRVVIGTENEESYRKMADLYAPFVRQGNPILAMDPISAEMTKYACNAFLAARISFINELSILCDKVGGDIEKVRRGMTSDSRIGRAFLYPGPGYGGSCFPKDVQGLLATARQNGVPLEIVAAAETANARQKLYLPSLIKQHFGTQLKGKVIALWGLAFKPNTDDMREAPSLTIIKEMLAAGAKIRAFDPAANETARRMLGETIAYCGNGYDAVQGADAMVLVTEWNEFRRPDFDRIKSSLKTPVIFDGRNIYTGTELQSMGFTYYSIGRNNLKRS